VQPVAPLDGTTSHVPREAFGAIWHRPEQHSVSVLHASPNTLQYDTAASHVPLLQNLEQHSPFVVHELPDVLQVGLSGAHAPPVQTPPQHSPPAPHDAPSDLHWLPEHAKSTQANEQQSGPTEQAAPDIRHWPATWEHRPTRSSQFPVQHSPSVEHAVPVEVHDGWVALSLPPQETTRSTTTAKMALFMGTPNAILHPAQARTST
jgi:hypothetical protein